MTTATSKNSPEIRSVRTFWSALTLQTKPETIRTGITHTQILILLPANVMSEQKTDEDVNGSSGFGSKEKEKKRLYKCGL